MVFGESLIDNARQLANHVSHIEVVLFHTPMLNNIPGDREIRELNKIAREEAMTLSVHLPASLEIASSDRQSRDAAIRLAADICRKTLELEPAHFILHLPYTRPVLVPDPEEYIRSVDPVAWRDWTLRATESLQILATVCGDAENLLVENINYSPALLEGFWDEETWGICIDIGHLLLGREDIPAMLNRYAARTKEVHIHGVRGAEEHLGLEVLPPAPLAGWLQTLACSLSGVLTLEVFSPEDLGTSLSIVRRAVRDLRT